MKSITIHDLDDALAARIAQRAREDGTSRDETIEALLAEALGMKLARKRDRREDFLDLFGSWSDDDLREFEAVTSDMARVHPREW